VNRGGRLIDRMQTLSAEYDARTAAALAGVVRWEWASAGARREIPLPFWGEFNGDPSTDRTLRRPPADRSRGVEYGYGEGEEILVTRHYRADGTLEYERLADGLDSVTYFHDPASGPVVVNASWTERDAAGRTARYVEHRPRGKHDDFTPVWEGDRLVALKVTITEDEVVEFDDTMRYGYDETGELVMIRGERGLVLYRRPMPDQRRAVTELVAGLAAAIVAAATRVTGETPVGAILLGVDFADPLPPPTWLIIASQGEAHDDDGRVLLDVGPEIDVTLSELLAAVKAHLVVAEDDALLGRIVKAIAGRLPDDLAASNLERADGFAVIVRDVD